MKRCIAICILVIVLICINWLKTSYAQLTPEQIRAYQELLNRQQSEVKKGNTSYRTPSIYDDSTQNDTDLVQRGTPGLFDSLAMAPPQTDIELGSADSLNSGVNQLILPANASAVRFGKNFFTGPSQGETNQFQIPDDYLLGPGDNLIISLWGRVNQEWTLTIDRQGRVFIPKIGEIEAWGVTLDQFAERLDTRLSQAYTGYKRKITLGKIRTVRVFVYGEVKSPGGYAVSALATLFNVLYEAGGPTDNGSLRQIKLIRNKKASPVDLYDFLVRGDKSCDLPLMSGDVIFVPLVGPQATIRGEVKRPGIYELVGDECVSDLIELAGGPTAKAYLNRLMLDRVGDNDSRVVMDLDFSDPDGKNDLLLADGDDLSIFSIYAMRQNIVWVTGQVKHPGTFERFDGMTISDLLDKGQLPPADVHWERADLFRRTEDGRRAIIAVDLAAIKNGNQILDIPLTDLDSLHVYSVSDVDRDRFVYIEGMIQKPGRYPLYEQMTIADLIFQAGDLNENAYLLEAELARIDSLGNNSIISVPLNRTDGFGLPLMENDRLFIRQIPGYQLHRLATIEGEVIFPGRYPLTSLNETFWQLLNRAGGLTEKAFPVGTICRRPAIIDNLRRKNIDNIFSHSQPLLADSTGALLPMPGTDLDLDKGNMSRIVVDMNLIIATGGAQGDFVLQAGDQIYIPEIPTGVSVLGEVCANGSIQFEPGIKVKEYINKAGGFTRRADKGETRLIKANGRVLASGIMGKSVDLGDIIIVPAEIKQDRDWTRFITTSMAVLTGLATTVLIVDRL